jgi:hypothetical protein
VIFGSGFAAKCNGYCYKGKPQEKNIGYLRKFFAVQ